MRGDKAGSRTTIQWAELKKELDGEIPDDCAITGEYNVHYEYVGSHHPIVSKKVVRVSFKAEIP